MGGEGCGEEEGVTLKEHVERNWSDAATETSPKFVDVDVLEEVVCEGEEGEREDRE